MRSFEQTNWPTGSKSVWTTSPSKFVGGRLARETLDLNEPRGVACEARVPDFFAAAFESVNIGIAGAAVVGAVDQAVAVDVERRVHRNARAGRAADLEPRDAVERLAEVHHEDAGPRVRHGDRLQDFRDADRFDHLRFQGAARRFHHLGPAAIWNRRNPARDQPGISMRASYSSPSYSLFARIGPSVVSFHFLSLTTVSTEPSAYSRRS